MAMQPVDPDTFATAMAALGPFEPSPHLAVAVSGGSDSLALLLLLRNWLAPRGGRITALTVNHGLRPEAAQECRQIGDLVARLNAGSDIGTRNDIDETRQPPVDHVILNWLGEKPATGIMAAARQARYRLLTDWCRAHDVLHLLVGHHADDQAETLLMRQNRGSGGRGLAGMAGIRPLDGVRLLRPLLASRKAALRAVVEAAGLSWIEDPSNLATRYERVRWRQELAQTPDIRPLLDGAVEAGRQRDRAEKAAAAWLAAHGRIDPHGYLAVPARVLASCAPDDMALVLGAGILAMGNADFAPAPAALARLTEQMCQQVDFTVTLGGCLLVRRGNVLQVFREVADCAEPVELAAGQAVLWDGRFVATLAGEGRRRRAPDPLHVAALGERGLALPCPGAQEERPQKERHRSVAAHLAYLPHQVRASLPALWQGDRLLAVGSVSNAPEMAKAGCPDRNEEIHRLNVSFLPRQAATSCGFTVVLPARHTM